LDTTEQTEMVASHNKWRQTVGTPAITWSESLVLSQIFVKCKAVLICGQNYPAKAINCW
jgi:hypothetical protein